MSASVAGAARYTGAAVKRVEDPRILTGRGNYVDDIQLPGMLHAAFLRSPVAHARIVDVDASAAREAPGVVAVFTGAEMEQLLVPGGYGAAEIFRVSAPVYPALATDKVRFVGDPIAVVIAETRYLAEDACEHIFVDYDDLAAITTIDQALDPTLPAIFDDYHGNVVDQPKTAVFGDVDGVFARADRVIRTRLTQHRHQPVPMEGRAIVADYDTDADRLDVWIATQGVHSAQAGLANRLGMSVENVRVRADGVGGSFGLKVGASREEVAAAAAARALGRPVKWIEDRFEHLNSAGQARDERADIEVAFTDAGDILGLRVDMTMDVGAYPSIGGVLFATMIDTMPSAYKIQAFAFTSRTVSTNKAIYGSYRGPWAAETWMRERIFDLVAREVGMEPYDLRLRNVVTPGEEPSTTVTGRSLAGINIKGSLLRAGELIDIPAFRELQAAARADGRYLGLGVASYIEPAPGTRKGNTPLGSEGMRMEVADDGTVTVYTGQMPHGQGHQTTIMQIAADELGVPLGQVTVVVGDTDRVPPGLTGGSRAATMMGGATTMNARALRASLLDAAGHLLECDVNDLDIVDGEVQVRGVPSAALTLGDIVRFARESGRVPADVDTSFETRISYDGGQGGWSGGTHCAVVQVDIETGKVRFERYLVLEDCGAVINPAIVDGQIRGGVAQGIGAVLLERDVYDESGQHMSASFMDYLLPTACDIPRIEIEHIAGTPTDPHVNFRGVGEGGMIIAPAAVCNAIEDALATLDVRIHEQHLPPARILELAGVIQDETSRDAALTGDRS